MKINNENKKYIYITFHNSYKYSTYQNSWIHVLKNIKITYQVMRRQQITQNIIHENSSRKIYSSIY